MAGTAGLRTVEDAIRHDIALGLTFADTKDRKGVAFNILWLTRALRFVLLLLQNIDPDDRTFGAADVSKAAALDAYSRSLKPYHGFVLSQLFGTMVARVPARSAFLRSTRDAAESEQATLLEMRAFVGTAWPLVERLHQFLAERGLNDPWKA